MAKSILDTSSDEGNDEFKSVKSELDYDLADHNQSMIFQTSSPHDSTNMFENSIVGKSYHTNSRDRKNTKRTPIQLNVVGQTTNHTSNRQSRRL